MPRFYVTVGPQSGDEHPLAITATWVMEAADEQAALDNAEVGYRRSHPDVDPLRLRLICALTRR